MAARVQHKRSSVAGNIPDPSVLEIGEIAINFSDRYVYTKNGASAVIRLNGNIPLSQPANQIAGDSYLDPATGKIYAYYDLNGGGEAWRELAAAEDLTPFIKHDGSVSMTGPLTLSGTATGSQAVSFDQVVDMIGGDLDDYVKKDGTTVMTGRLTLSDDPVDDLHAATKQYVDTAVDIATPDLSAFLPKTGGVMSGQITLPGGGTGNQAATANEIAAAVAAHQGLPDPHSQYATDANLTAHKAAGATEHPAVTGSVNGFMIAADKARLDTITVASDADLVTGTDDEKFVTPLKFDTYLSTYVLPNLRTKLGANTTIYIRSDGNYSYYGLANNAGGAKLTWQAAVDLAASYDFNGFTVTLEAGESSATFTAGMIIPPMVGQKNPTDLTIRGNASTPANIQINTTSADGISILAGTKCKIEGFKLTSTTSGWCIRADGNGTYVEIGTIEFGAAASGHVACSHYAITVFTVSYTISGGGVLATHYSVILGAMIGKKSGAPGLTVTVTGTPAFAVFAFAQIMANIACGGFTFSGAATGQRYQAVTDARINVSGGASTFFPGNSAGTVATGGTYV